MSGIITAFNAKNFKAIEKCNGKIELIEVQEVNKHEH